MIKTLDPKEIQFIISRNYIGYLAYTYKNEPFVLPVTYFYNKEQNNIICYSAKGHKIEALRANRNVTLCVTTIDAINDWKSVVAYGKYKEQTGSEAIALLHQFSLGVKDLVFKTENKDLDFISEFSSDLDADKMPIIYTIEIEKFTGRKRKS